MVLAVNFAARTDDRESEINRLTDKCMRSRYQDADKANITFVDFRLCVIQAIKMINRGVQKPDLTEDVILHNIEMYRNMLPLTYRNDGAKSLRVQDANYDNRKTEQMTTTDKLSVLATDVPGRGVPQNDQTDYNEMKYNHRSKRNTNNVLDWEAIYDFFIRLRQSTLAARNNRPLSPQLITNNRLTSTPVVPNGRLTGPQRARAAIAAIGPLPIGRRFTSPFTDPRTRGDPLPIGPLRRRQRRGFYPLIQHRINGQFKDLHRKIGDPTKAKFKSILTDARTKAEPMLMKTFNPLANQLKGVNALQIKTGKQA